MNKELTPIEWLNYYKRMIQESNKTFRPNGFEIIEKSLKALEIIKEKNVDVSTLKNSKNVDDYNSVWLGFATNPHRDLTQEEYDLLKEVLLCGSQK